MDSKQITNILSKNKATQPYFIGCFINNNIPIQMLVNNAGDFFIIVNTITNVAKMGHWILFFMRNRELLFFDSFGLHPEVYNGSIYKFYCAYPGRKRIITNSALQNKFSLVCGAYVIYVAFMLSTNRSLCTTFSKFSSNTCKNDRFVVRFLYNVASIVLSCNDKICMISNV